MAPKRKRTTTTASTPPSRAKRTNTTQKADGPRRASLPSAPKRRSSRITATNGQGPAPTAVMGGGTALEAQHGDVTKGERKESPKSPLMQLPRNVRDLIYAHLLTAPSYIADRDAEGELDTDTESATDTLASIGERDQILRDGILPGSAHGYPFIVQAMGLLCANKQLHAEASEFLYSKNTFIIMPLHTRVHCFWNCSNDTCRKDIPCLVHLRNIKQIKHLCILVRNPYKFDDPSHDQGARCLHANLSTIVRCLNEAEVKLETLEVRYLSFINGRIEEIRGKLDSMLHDGGKPPTIAIRLSNKKGVRVEPGPKRDYSMLFKNTRVLDELKKAADIAKSVSVFGDLSSAYIRELSRDLLPSIRAAPILSLMRKSGQASESPTPHTGAQAPQKRKRVVAAGDDDDWASRHGAQAPQKRRRMATTEDGDLLTQHTASISQKRSKLADKVATDLATHQAMHTPQKVETMPMAAPSGFPAQQGYSQDSIYHQMPSISSYMGHQQYCNSYAQYMSEMTERMQQTPIYSSPEMMEMMWGWNAGQFRSYDYYG